MARKSIIYDEDKLEMIRNHHRSIGYMAMVTDFLLYKKNQDFHLKITLTVWDFDHFTTEVKYLNYITTWGWKQFFDLCTDFGLIRYRNDELWCNLGYLKGAYCYVSYYDYDGEPEQTADHICEIDPVKWYHPVSSLNLWDMCDFEKTFRDMEIYEVGYCDFNLSENIEGIEEVYLDFLDGVVDTGYSIAYIYCRNYDMLCKPESISSSYVREVLTTPIVPLHDYHCAIRRYSLDHNMYIPVTENDSESEIYCIENEPPLRSSEAEARAMRAESIRMHFETDDFEVD